MNTINKFRTALFAAPFVLATGMATAGGLSEPEVIPAPAPAPVQAAPPIMMGPDWTGFYTGGQIGFGQLSSGEIEEPDDPSGALYGLHAGYNYDFGSFVVGAEVDIDGTNISADVPDTELKSVARAKLKLGYDAGQLMPYVTAGVARIDTTDDLNDTTDGQFAGLGVSYLISDRFMVGGEVLQHQFEDVADIDDVDIDATTLSLRASFKF